jgi:hypothetical protein
MSSDHSRATCLVLWAGLLALSALGILIWLAGTAHASAAHEGLGSGTLDTVSGTTDGLVETVTDVDPAAAASEPVSTTSPPPQPVATGRGPLPPSPTHSP